MLHRLVWLIVKFLCVVSISSWPTSDRSMKEAGLRNTALGGDSCVLASVYRGATSFEADPALACDW